MKSYYLYFVLLVFCSVNCCGWNYPGDELIPTGIEQIYFLESKDEKPVILHIERYDRKNNCENKIEERSMFSYLYSFEDSSSGGEIDLKLYDKRGEQLIDESYLSSYNLSYVDREKQEAIRFYSGRWSEVNYDKLSKEDLILKIANSSFLKNEYFLSDDTKMEVIKSNPVNQYLREGSLNILKTKNGQKAALQLASNTKYYEDVGRVSMKLWQHGTDSAKLISISPMLYYDKTSVFLPLPKASNFSGYVTINDRSESDSTALTIYINL